VCRPARAGLAAAVGIVLALPHSGAAEQASRSLEVQPHERLLVVAPHPDDETLGAGGLAQRVLERGGSVRVVLMTAGDGYVEAVVRATGQPRPRPAEYIAYGERRLGEARAALRELGKGRVRLELLGFPDGGLDQLLHAYWQRSHPELSSTTGAREPPYPEAAERDVAYDGADLHRELVHVLRETQPTLLVFPDPLDKHPDHRASGLFTLLAVESWTRDGAPMPQLLAYLVHWPNWPPGWDDPKPTPRASEAPLELPDRLLRRGLATTALALRDAELSTKRAALARYGTQQEAMPSLLAAFVRRTEPFSVFTPDEVRRVGQMVERHLTRRQVSRPPASRGR
jgi:LmbE family N-acetylglucosaminyl deacetylase